MTDLVGPPGVTAGLVGPPGGLLGGGGFTGGGPGRGGGCFLDAYKTTCEKEVCYI